MATTTNLLATLIEVSQSQKETTANAAFQIFDKGIAGSLSKSITSADVTLSDDEARNAILNLSGTLTGNRNLVVPTRTKIYAVYNGTGGAFTLTVKTSGGTGVIVPQGERRFVYCDGTNVVSISAPVTLSDFKESVRAATTANITLSGTQTIDGVSCIAGDRVLVKDQSTGSQNGIYVVASGAWSRAADFDADAEVTGGCVIPVSEGTANGNQIWLLTTNDPITVGSTSLVFSQLTVQTIGFTSFKAAVRVATVTAGTLASSFENGDTVDGVTLATNDRILIKDQADPTQNGIYTVNASGAPTRATDFDANGEAVPGCVIPVTEGTTNGGTIWMFTTNPPISLGSTNLIFSHLGATSLTTLDALTDVTITAPATDQVLTYNGSAWVNAAAGGGNSLVAPPNVASFTWINQGDASASDDDVYVGATLVPATIIFAPGASGPMMRILKKSAPSPPYTIVAAYLPAYFSQNFYYAGVIWRQNGTGEVILVGGRTNGNILHTQVSKWDSATAFNGNYSDTLWEFASAGLFWVKIEDDNTNRKVYCSADGKTWLQLHSISRTDFLTADEVGFAVVPQNSQFQSAISLVHWEES